MSELPFVRTAVDVRLGDKLESFDIDYEALVRRMRDEGFTEDQIASTSLTFSADCYGQADGDAVEALLGEYNRASKDITVYPAHLVTAAQVDSSHKFVRQFTESLRTYHHPVVAHGAAQAAERESLDAYSTVLSKRATTTLYHELRHKRNDIVQPVRGMNRYKAKVLARPMGAYVATLVGLDMASIEIVDSLNAHPLYQLAAIPFMIYAARKAFNAASYTDREIYLMNPDEISARDAANDVSEQVVSMRLKPLMNVSMVDGILVEAEPECAPEATVLPKHLTTVYGLLATGSTK